MRSPAMQSLSGAARASAYLVMDSPWGPLYLQATSAGISHISFVGADDLALRALGDERPVKAACDAFLREAQRQLQEYIEGRRYVFALALDLSRGTPFQRQVWEATRQIPFGETRSYGEIARAIGKADAPRAVGQALGHNPIGIVVPCHRVISSDGSLGGFTGGLEIKKRLLAFERAL